MMAEFAPNLKFRPCFLPEVGKESTITGNFSTRPGEVWEHGKAQGGQKMFKFTEMRPSAT